VPKEIEINFLDRNLQRTLEVHPRESPKFPAAVDDTVAMTIPLFNTSPLENVLFETQSTVGDGGFAETETSPTPDGKVRIPIAVELSHNDTSNARTMWISLEWDRGGITTTIALCPAQSQSASRPIALEDLTRLYLGPTFRMHGSASALALTFFLTLKVAYIERGLGETFPP